MKKVSLFIVVNAISLYLVSLLMDSMYIGSLGALLILTIIFGILNLTVKPILQLFSLPITFLTLGLFSLVINAIVLKLAFSLVPGVQLYGFISAIGASILLSIVNTIMYKILD
jgi:putative membrane protein